jgi:glycosyltransferase involved in cell wall biosynthesis
MAKSTNNDTVKVSIVCISYNQEKYIEQAIKSFLMQKHDFVLEIIISDDASTDGTQKIISDYSNKHPKLIKTILRNKNVGIQENLIGALKYADGKYIALCEGDDYWTDPNKIQKQYEVLESNNNVSLCFHPVKVFFENGEMDGYIYPNKQNGTNYDFNNLLKCNYIQTNSVMYRRQKYDNIPKDILPLDWYLHIYHAQFGDIHFVDEVMASYRRQPGGAWWDAYNNKDLLLKRYNKEHLNFFFELLKLLDYRPRYKKIIRHNIFLFILDLLKLKESEYKKIIKSYYKKYPDRKNSLNIEINKAYIYKKTEYFRYNYVYKKLNSLFHRTKRFINSLR